MSLSLLSLGLVSVAPSAAAGGCNNPEQGQIGGHDSGDLFHICSDVDVFEDTETVPIINVTCPTCVPQPPGDPVPPLPGVTIPGVNPPPDPGEPRNDNCIASTGVCHPSVSELSRWLSNYQWDPFTCDTFECVHNVPSISDLQSWAEGNLASFLTWLDEQVDRVSVETTAVTVVEADPSGTHANVHEDPVLDEACQVIKGDGATWGDCDPVGSTPDPCDHVDDCHITTSAAVTTDHEQTTGLLVETDDGSLFLPSVLLT